MYNGVRSVGLIGQLGQITSIFVFGQPHGSVALFLSKGNGRPLGMCHQPSWVIKHRFHHRLNIELIPSLHHVYQNHINGWSAYRSVSNMVCDLSSSTLEWCAFVSRKKWRGIILLLRFLLVKSILVMEATSIWSSMEKP